MILIDYNQIMLASLFVSIGNHHNIDINENSIRHMFLNSLRANRNKFAKDFGEIIICADGQRSWRKDYFPYYKSNRKKSREESELDWTELFRIMNMIREEVKEFFPYKVMHYDHVEADDIIGILTHEFGREFNDGSENILILSGDKDYIQLQKYANVKQYNPVMKKWVENKNPDLYLQEHIIRGDGGDGVPNIMSPDNSIAIGERQKSMTQKRIAEFLKGPEFMDETTKIRYHRNKMMIDLLEIPEKYKKTILEDYYSQEAGGREKLFNFFIQKKLKHLMPLIQEF